MDVLTAVEPARIAALRERGGFFWLDLEAPAPAEIDRLGRLLGLHPLATADTRNFGQRPKLDEFDDHVLLVFFSAVESRDDPQRSWRPSEHHLYVSGDFLVTVRRDPFTRFERLRYDVERRHDETEAHVVYRVLRALCDAFDAPLMDLAARVDALEDEVFGSVERVRIEAMHRLRQEIADLLRRAAAQRDGFTAAAASILRVRGLTRGRREELSDIRDQLVEVASELQRHHDDLTSVISLYFSASGERLNRLAYRLTIIATFFVIGTLVTGFFGQNFGWLVDSIDSRHDFLVFGVGGLVVPIAAFGAVVWWRRRDWL